MMICIYFGVPKQPTNLSLLKKADWQGMLYASLGLSLIYAALDQGNRLDWLNSGLVNALLWGGGILLVAFFLREATQEHPWIDLSVASGGNIPLIALYIAFFRVIILSSSYIIPQYLGTIQNYRALEIGSVLMWIALPQFVLGPIVATILRFMDARIPMALGFAFVGCACFLSSHLTAAWAGPDFLVGQILQAVGQTLALTSLVWFAISHLRPEEIFTVGAILQTGRLFGSEIGSSFIQTFIRMREQVYSNLIGLHVVSGTNSVGERLQGYANAVFGHSVSLDAAHGRALALLQIAVRKQAYVLAYIDGFTVLGFAVIGALILMVLLRSPPEQSILKSLLNSTASPSTVRDN
jgi:DHA2 family multidrug resistance protein